MRDVTRWTGVTTADLANWSRRGLTVRLPETRQGAERVFTKEDRDLLLVLSFIKTLAFTGTVLSDAYGLAVAWANREGDGALPRFWIANPRGGMWRDQAASGEFADLPTFDELAGDPTFDDASDDSWSDTIADQQDFPATVLICIDRAEIVRRVDHLCALDDSKAKAR
jgi:hypothetical protein